jgi:hypothetical protein
MVFTRDDYLVDISHRLKGMREQESSHYTIPDYLAIEWQKKLREATEAMQHCNVSIGVHGAGNDVVTPPSSAPIAAVVVAGVGDAFQARAAYAAVVAATANHGGDAPARPAANDGANDDGDEIHELWREKICEWCYQVVDHFDFNREVVSVAMSYLDRSLATRTVNRRIFQLAAMTALYLAIKLYEPGKLRMSSIIDLSRGYFVAEHIGTMELSMLQSLGWHVHPPTPLAFVRDFMRLVSGEIDPGARHDVNELARFMTELSVCDYWFVTKKPSSIALASLVNAIELQGPRRVNPKYKIEFLTRVVDLGIDIASDEEILACYERLRQMYDAGGFTPTLEDDPVPVVRAAAPPAAAAPAAAGGNEGEDEDVQEPAARRSPTAIVDYESESESESEPESEPEFEFDPYLTEPQPHLAEEHHKPETLGETEPEPEPEANPCKSNKESAGDYSCEHGGKRGKVAPEPDPKLEGVSGPTVVRTVSPEVKKKTSGEETSTFVNESRKTPPELLTFDEVAQGDDPAKKKSSKRKKSDDDDEWTPRNRGGI